MPAPYKKVFEFQTGKQLTSVVLDRAEFDHLVDRCGGIANPQGERMGAEKIQSLKDACHIPLMARGTLTEFIFVEFGIETDYASFMVRGAGPKVMDATIKTILPPDRN